MTCQVLVCDDDPNLSEDWVEAIRGVVSTEYNVLAAPGKEDIRLAAHELLHRRSAVRERKARAAERCLFDGVDILIVDYDLLHIDENNAQYTGEGLGRLARMFSDCTVVVVLNQYPEAQFDLRLRGHLQSHADLNVDADLLATPGLWHAPPWEGFRPWSWQTLSRAVHTQREREKIIAQALDCSVSDTLGMQVEDASRLSDSAFGFLAPDAHDYGVLRDITFRTFLSEKSNDRDARAISQCDDRVAAKVAAARIGKWLEREVLGPQDALIDIPHLLQRFPFLLGDNVADLGAWNEAVHSVETIQEILDEKIWFEHDTFLSRPAVWGRRLKADAEIDRLRSDFDFTEVPSYVFAEDRSVFVEMSDAVEFRAGFHNAFDRRFLLPIKDVRYAPQRRLAFGS